MTIKKFSFYSRLSSKHSFYLIFLNNNTVIISHTEPYRKLPITSEVYLFTQLPLTWNIN